MTFDGRTTTALRIPLGDFTPFSGRTYEIEVPIGAPCRKLPDGAWAVTHVHLAFNVLFCCLDGHPEILIDEQFIETVQENLATDKPISPIPRST
jgi:hypothetical protein